MLLPLFIQGMGNVGCTHGEKFMTQYENEWNIEVISEQTGDWISFKWESDIDNEGLATLGIMNKISAQLNKTENKNEWQVEMTFNWEDWENGDKGNKSTWEFLYETDEKEEDKVVLEVINQLLINAHKV